MHGWAGGHTIFGHEMRRRYYRAMLDHFREMFRLSNKHLWTMIREGEPLQAIMLDGNQLAARMQQTMRQMSGVADTTVNLNPLEIHNAKFRR